MVSRLAAILTILVIFIVNLAMADYQNWSDLPHCAQACLTNIVNASITGCSEVSLRCFCEISAATLAFGVCLDNDAPCDSDPVKTDVVNFQKEMLCDYSVNTGFRLVASKGSETSTLGLSPGRTETSGSSTTDQEEQTSTTTSTESRSSSISFDNSSTPTTATTSTSAPTTSSSGSTSSSTRSTSSSSRSTPSSSSHSSSLVPVFSASTTAPTVRTSTSIVVVELSSTTSMSSTATTTTSGPSIAVTTVFATAAAPCNLNRVFRPSLLAAFILALVEGIVG